jgi:hypothetical protein
MRHMIPAAKRLIVGAVAVGALSLGAAGVAGSAGAATTGGTATATTAGSHFNCANATRVLGRIQSAESHIAAGLPKLTAAQAKAASAGHTKLAARLQRRITRYESAAFKARLAKISQKIETKCQVTAPSTGSVG